MADNLETSNIVVEDGQGNKQLAQAVASQSGSVVWSDGEKTGWCIVEDAQGNKQLALKVYDYNGGGGGGGSASWGSITGTLSDQTDLQNALNSKADKRVTVADTTSTSATIANVEGGKDYTFTNALTALSITAITSSFVEANIYFTADTGIAVTLPANTPTIGDFTFTAGNSYVISICNGIAVRGELN